MADLLSSAVSPWAQPQAWDTIVIGGLSWYGKFEIKNAARKYRWNIADGWGFAGAYEVFQAQPPARWSITFYLWADEQYSTYLALLDKLFYSPTHLPPNNSAAAARANAIAAAQANLKTAIATAESAQTLDDKKAGIADVQAAQQALAAAKASSKGSATSSSINALTIVHPQLQNNRIAEAVVENVGDLEKQSDDLLYAFTVDFIEFVPIKPMPPQAPDTAGDRNDPIVSAQVRSLETTATTELQNLSNAVANVGSTGGLPHP